MEDLKISVVITILNEKENIVALLDSLAKQDLVPDEIVIVDAGSVDGTVENIRIWQDRYPRIKTRLMTCKGANRSQGRNSGIKQARNQIIAVTDAGCVADKKWLWYLAKKLATEKADAVAGYYSVKFKTRLQEIIGWYLAVLPERFDPNQFLPSSRSLLVTKRAVQKVGGYPENLNYCEDLVMADKLKRQVNMAVEPLAIVNWTPPGSMKQFFHTVSRYARGDIEAGYWPHVKRISSVIARYGLMVWKPWLFGVYIWYPIIKFRRRICQWNDVRYLVFIQFTADMAVIWGLVLYVINSSWANICHKRKVGVEDSAMEQ